MAGDLPNGQHKQAGEVLDYLHDWTEWLDGDTIETSAWSVPEGLTESQASTNTTTTATVWLQGGTEGSTYTLVNTITTAAGRTGQERLFLAIRED